MGVLGAPLYHVGVLWGSYWYLRRLSIKLVGSTQGAIVPIVLTMRSVYTKPPPYEFLNL